MAAIQLFFNIGYITGNEVLLSVDASFSASETKMKIDKKTKKTTLVNCAT